MLRRIETDDIEAAADEMYETAKILRAIRGKDPLATVGSIKTALLNAEERVIVALGRLATAGVPIPQMPGEGTFEGKVRCEKTP